MQGTKSSLPSSAMAMCVGVVGARGGLSGRNGTIAKKADLVCKTIGMYRADAVQINKNRVQENCIIPVIFAYIVC